MRMGFGGGLIRLAAVAGVLLASFSVETNARTLREQLVNKHVIQQMRNLGRGDIYRKLGRPVGKLVLRYEDDTEGACTASLIADDLVLTNHHCVKGKEGNKKLISATLLMGYLDNSLSGLKTYRVVARPVESRRSGGYDYAILRVKGQPGQPGQDWGTVRLKRLIPKEVISLFVIHHPGGDPQMLTTGYCRTTAKITSGVDLRYTCDTIEGSSGAPVFDNNSREVIALHFGGEASLTGKKYNAGNLIARLARVSPIIRRLVDGRAPPSPPPSPPSSPQEPQPSVCLDIPFKINGKTRCLKAGANFKDCDGDWCPEVVVIPAGRFQMGSSSREMAALKKKYPDKVKYYKDEMPRHRVRISKPFALGKYEVTVKQFRTFVEATDYKSGSKCKTWEDGKWKLRSGRSFGKPGYPQKDNHPVVCVSWDDAVAYAKWLSDETGENYRLPTEAEWEYAVRAKSRSRYHFGNREKDLCTYANGADETKSPDGKVWTNKIPCKDGHWFPASVGSFKPNGFGVFDMHGNVWEWVSDWYGDYKSGSQTDPKGPESGSYRVSRGGSWSSDARYLRSAIRNSFSPDFRNYYLGFRLLRQPS